MLANSQPGEVDVSCLNCPYCPNKSSRVFKFPLGQGSGFLPWGDCLTHSYQHKSTSMLRRYLMILCHLRCLGMLAETGSKFVPLNCCSSSL